MKFFVRTSDNPILGMPVGPVNAYTLTDESRENEGRGQFAPVESFLIHAKFYKFKKPVAALVRGIGGRFGKDGKWRGNTTLLVQYAGNYQDSYGRSVVEGSWDTTEMANTTEGNRFTRTVIRFTKMLKVLSREASKKRSTAEQLAKREAERGHKEGQCPACLNDYIVHSGKMVLHGYSRPGIGYTVGSCFGVGYPNLEVSKKGLVAFIGWLTFQRKSMNKALAQLPTLTELAARPRYIGDEPKTFKKGEPGFDKVLADAIQEAEYQIRMITVDIDMANELEQEWAPKPWPRKPKV